MSPQIALIAGIDKLFVRFFKIKVATVWARRVDTSAARFRCLQKPKGVQKFPQPRILAANTTGGADAPTELVCNGGVWPRTSASDLIGPIRFIGLRHLKVAPGPALIAQLQPASPKKLHLVVNTTINFKTRQKLICINHFWPTTHPPTRHSGRIYFSSRI